MNFRRVSVALVAALVAAFGAGADPVAAEASCVVIADGQRSPSRAPQAPEALVVPIEDRGGVSVFEVLGDYDRSFGDGEPNFGARMDVARAFYEEHGDDYDFLLVATDFEFDTDGATAMAWLVRNDVQGINLPAYDLSNDFGSAGRLRNYVDLAALSRYALDPLDPGFELLLVAATHEILHTWGTRLRFRLPDGSLSGALTTGESHWSYLYDSQGSVLYGNDWRDDGNGSFTSLAVDKVWGPLDLYLAGFAGPDEIPPLLLIDNPTIEPQRRGQPGETIQGGAATVTIDDIVAAEGPRVPAAGESPDRFRAAVLYLVRPGATPSDAELLALERFRHALEIRFAILTGGRASLEVTLAPPGGSGGGGPGPIDPGDPRGGSASLPDALAWLRSRQGSDGSWQDKPETSTRDTAVAASVLTELDSLFVRGAEAADWLQLEVPPSSDYAARALAALGRLQPNTSNSALTSALLARQNSDGGWGAGARYGSDPIDTAMAIEALRSSGLSSSHPALVRAGNWLVDAQNTDGGWGAAAGGASRIAPTTAALAALVALARVPASGPDALSWIAGRQNPDGGFGDSPSTAHDTAQVVDTIRALDEAGVVDLAAAVAYLDGRQTIEGSWEGSVYTTARVAATLSQARFPDLAFAGALAAEPAAPVVGELVQLTIPVRNAGALAAPASMLRLFDGDPDSGGQPIGPDVELSELAALASTTLAIAWDTTGLDPGTHVVHVILDADEAIEEASESNNRATLPIEIDPAPVEADLSVRADEISFLPPHPAVLPVEIAIVATVRNLGSTDVPEALIRLHRGEGTSGDVLGEQTIALPARASAPVSFFDTLVEPGAFGYTLVLDPDAVVVEADESNNQASATVTTAPAIDLEVTGSDLTLLDGPAHPGADVRFRVVLRNRGTVGGGSFTAAFAVTDGTTTRELPEVILQIEPGQSAERTVVWRVDLEGDLQFVATLDPDDLVPEADETNNSASLAFPSTPLAMPNLAVAPGDFEVSPLPGREGSPLDLSILVRNNGGATTGETRVAFYDGPPASGFEIAAATLPPIVAGGSTEVAAVWTEVPDAGDRVIHAVVDPEGLVEEHTESDNSTFQVVEVHSLPDLAISAGSLSLDPAFPVPGEPVALSVQVANLGEQDATPVAVRAYLGDPGAGGVLLADSTLDPVSGQASGIATLGWTFDQPTGQAAIFVVVDADEVLIEGDEANNSAGIQVTVQDDDSYVSAPFFSPNGDGVLDSTTYAFRVGAPVELAVEIRDVRERLVRRETNPAWSGGEGSFEWDGTDADGAVARDGEYRLTVVDAGSGERLGAARATLDTDRTSLFHALGTPYEWVENATCELPPIRDARPTSDARTAFVVVDGSPTYPSGIYRVATEESAITQVVTEAQLGQQLPACPRDLIETSLRVSPDGSRIAFATWRGSPCTSRRETWISDAAGTQLARLPQSTSTAPFPIGFHGNSDRLLVEGEDGTLVTVPIADPSLAHSIFPDASSLWFAYEYEPYIFSPDRSRLVLFVDGASAGAEAWLVDLGEESSRLLVALESGTGNDWWNAAWSFDGTRIVVLDPEPGRLHVFSRDGEPIGNYLVETEPPEPSAVVNSRQLSRARTSPREVALAIEWSLPEDLRIGELVVVDLASGEVRHVAWTEPSSGGGGGGSLAGMGEGDAPPLQVGHEPIWAPFDRALLWGSTDRFWYGESLVGVELDEDARRTSLFPGYEVFEVPTFSADGRALFFESWGPADPEVDPCTNPEDGLDYFAFRSLLNLGTELRARRSPNGPGFLLEGSAADRNFLRYRIEYAPATDPGSWTPVAPASTTEVFDAAFLTWVPPAPGAYHVRLSVEDRAGNRRTDRQHLFATDTPSVTDFWVSPTVFSPNGDGILETTTIHYRALEPLHVDTRIYDDRDVLVRTFARSHSQPEEESIEWDGRDESGVHVRDGVYRIELQDLEQFVEVDRTAPEVSLSWSNGGLVCLDPGRLPNDRHAAWSFGLLAGALDPPHDPPGVELEVGVGANPATWLDALLSPGEVPAPECAPNCPGISVSDYVNRRYRARATDAAGNERVELLELAEEELAIGAVKLQLQDPVSGLPTGWELVGCTAAPVEVLSEGFLRFEVGETARAVLAQVYVQYRAPGAPVWSETANAGIFEVGALDVAGAVPDRYFDVAWDPEPILGAGNVELRLRAIDSQGAEHLSGIVSVQVRRRLSTSFRVADVAPLGDEPPEPGDLLEQALAAGAIEPGLGLFVIVRLESATPPESVAAYLESDDDPRYSEWRRFDPLFVLPVGDVREYLFVIEDWQLCSGYRAYGTARLGGGLELVTAVETTETSCFAASLQLEPERAEVCGEPPPARIRARAGSRLHSGSPPPSLQLLTLARRLPDGSEDLLGSFNQPVPGELYDFEIAMAELPEGEHRFVARVTSVDGDTMESERLGVVDRTPPVLEITNPLEGQQLCSAEIEIRPGVFRRGFEIVGTVDEVWIEGSGGYSPRLSFDTDPEPRSWSNREGMDFLSTESPRPFRSVVDPGVAGEVTVRAAVWDRGGNLICGQRRFVADAAVGGVAGVSDDLISPDGDGVFDETVGTFVATEPVTLDVDVHPAVFDTTLGRWRVVGPRVRRLVDDIPVSDSRQFVWRGEDDSLALVPDDDYGLVVTAIDGCGNEWSRVLHVRVDATPPVAQIVSPAPGDPLPMLVPVAGIATDLNFLEWRLEFGVGADPTTWIEIATDNLQKHPPSEPFGTWNIFGLSGEHTLRLRATDRAGLRTEHRVTFDLTGPERLFSDLTALPPLFSPNGDERRESTTARVIVELESRLTVEIRTESDTLVRRLALAQLAEPGASTFVWDGADTGANPAPDGRYRMRVLAELEANPAITQDEQILVELDRTPPAVTVERPADGYVPGEGQVVGSIADERLVSWSVALATDPADPAWTDLASGTTAQSSAPLGSLEGLAEGDYALRVRAADAGEIQVEQIVPFVVDNTPPTVDLLAPADGDLLGAAGGAVAIRGTVAEEHLAEWRVELGAGTAPTTWIPLVSGADLPVGETLLDWLPTGVTDGLYTLRLIAEDRAGQSAVDSVQLTIDNLGPQVAIDSPAAGAWVREPAPILGTAADAHLESYTLAVAPAGSEAFTPIGGGASSIVGGQLHLWSALPVDGDYRLRLAAIDLAGNAASTEVALSVDTHPPGPTTLTATLENGSDARLEWSPSPEPDVIGYVVDRDGARLTPAPVPAPTLLDAALAEGSHAYVVRAVDAAGWEGAPSNVATVVVDVTPPTVAISAPSDATTVSGVVAIAGTAYSVDDFREYRLTVRAEPGGEPALLRRSPIPVVAAAIHEWSTAGLPEGASYRLRLEGEDLAGNVAVSEVVVTVDNVAPAPPTGLTATVVGGTGDVQAAWNANAEADLLGYLLYRDGVLVNAPGGVEGDLRRYALSETSYLDAGRPDGTFSYLVAAIDQAGNVSGPSAPAVVTIDRHPPRAEIVVPVDGARFEEPLFVRAESDDEDVASVVFEWRVAGSGTWAAFGSTDVQPPWETTFDPLAFEPDLEHGDFELRAVATDDNGATDPAAPAILVTYADLTPPSAPLDLVAAVDGGDVTLDWSASPEFDVIGYHVDRAGADGTSERLTATPVATPGYLDEALADGPYEYAVIAVDDSDNESEPSAPATARVATPRLTQPYTPTRQSIAALSGVSAYLGTAAGEIASGTGTAPIPPVGTDADGGFVWSDLPLADGVNTLTVRVTDPAGNRTRDAAVDVTVGAPPTAPASVVASPGAGANEVVVTWDANPEPDVVGYRPWRDGSSVLAPATIADATASASTESFPPGSAEMAIDGDGATYWAPWVDESELLAGQSLEVTWPETRFVARVEIDWLATSELQFAPTDFDLEAEFGGVWVPLATWRGNTDPQQQWLASDLYPTDRLRVVLWASPLDGVHTQPVRLAELRAVHQPILAATTLTETVPDGVHEYRVSALTTLGFESALSEPATIGVGDTTPPEPVVLAAEVTGSDVALSWTASPSPDVERYEVWRDGTKIGERTDLGNRTWLDAGRPNGTYLYVVVAVDGAGHSSPPSNAVEALVAVELPAPPTDLFVTPVAGGGALDLAWQPPSGPAPSGYRVHRAEVAGGPYSPVADAPAPAHRDGGLVDGSTYYYVVSALDAAGNESSASNEASGTPTDELPPPAPVLTFPAFAGAPRITLRSPIPVAGFAAEGAEIELRRNTVYAGEAVAASEFAVESLADVVWTAARLSPDGRWLWVEDDFGAAYVRRLDGPEVVDLPEGNGRVRWSADGASAFVVDGAVVRRFDVADEALEVVAALDEARIAAPSPSGDRLAVVALRAGQSGIWVLDLDSGDWTLIVPTATLDDLGEALEWSPAGTHLAWLRTTGATEIEVAEIETGLVVATLPASDGALSWSPDGAALLWTSSESGSDQVWRHDLASATSEALTAEPGEHAMPRWAPHAASFACVRDGGEVLEVDLEDGAARTWPVELFAGIEQLEWVAGGTALVVSDLTPSRIEPPGRFEVPGVALAGGDNRFVAIARDLAGNASVPSAETLVHLRGEALPNLAVLGSELVVLPAAPLAGGMARVTVVVRNLGGAAAPASDLTAAVTGPQGFVAVLAEGLAVPPLPPGGSAVFGFDLSLPTVAGSYLAAASVDVAGVVVEVREDDNAAERAFLVAADGTPLLAVATDRTTYGEDDTVELTAALFNAGSTFDGWIEIAIEDANGFELAELEPEAVIGLEHGATLEVGRTWSTDGVFAGLYQARARLFDLDGAEIAQTTAPFEIGEVLYLSAIAESERPWYTIGDSARVSGRIRYEAGNALLSGAIARLAVIDPAGVAVAQWQQPLGDLLPGAVASVVRTFATAGAEPGVHRVRVEVERGGSVLAVGEVPFELRTAPAALLGMLALSNPQPAIGEPLIAVYSVTNAGGADAFAVPIRTRLIDPATGIELARSESVIDLPAGATHAGSALFATDELGLAPYLAVLEAHWIDGGAPAWLVLDAEGFATADRTPPLATLIVPADSGLVGAQARAQATAVDQHSTVVSVAVAVDGGDWQPLALEEATLGLWGAALAPMAEGSHSVRLRARDAWDNEALTAEHPFEVDLTPPVIVVDGVEEGGIYPEPVLPVITVEDLHPGWFVVTLDGASLPAGTPVDQEGAHTLRVLAEDAAGNRATSELHFTIEALLPEASVTAAEVVEGDATGGELSFVVTLSQAVTRPVSVTYQTVDGTATDGSDFVGAAGILTFDPGAINGAIPISVIGDLLDEIDETLTLEIGSPQGATIGQATAVGTILDDDLPAVAVDDVTITEGDAGSQDAVVTLTLSTPGLEAVELDVATADGSATAGLDYTAVAETVSFVPGEVSATVAVPVLGDVLLEPDQTFTLELGTPSYGTLADATGLVTIVDDELCPGPELLVNPGAESPLIDGELAGWIEVVGGLWRPRWLEPVPFEGEASFFPGAVAAAELVQEIDLAPYASAIDEGAQAFRFSARVYSADEAIPDLARIVVEYRDEPGTVLDLFDSGALASPATWSVIEDERTAPAGTRRIRVRLLAERFTEPDLDVYFDALSLVSLRASAITVGGVGVTEPAPGETAWAEFPVLLACPTDRTTSVAYATRDGEAEAGTDYEAASGTLEVPASATSAQVAVEVLGDKLLESPEDFFLDLAASSEEVVVGAEAVARIDDAGCATEPLGLANDFNLFLWGDLLQSHGDVGGRLAAGGDVDLEAVSVGENLPGRDGAALVAGDGLSFAGGRVLYGDAIFGVWAAVEGVAIPDGVLRSGAPIDFEAERAALVALSESLATLAANGSTTLTPRGGLRLVGVDPALNVFEVDEAQLSAATSLILRAPAGSTALINVAGARVVAASLPIALENVRSDHVLFNFAEAEDVVFEDLVFRGSVLAPYAVLGVVESVVEGTVVAESLKIDGQLDHAPFAGCLPPPDPVPNCIEEGACE